jgi:hypothetical protein
MSGDQLKLKLMMADDSLKRPVWNWYQVIAICLCRLFVRLVSSDMITKLMPSRSLGIAMD